MELALGGDSQTSQGLPGGPRALLWGSTNHSVELKQIVCPLLIMYDGTLSGCGEGSCTELQRVSVTLLFYCIVLCFPWCGSLGFNCSFLPSTCFVCRCRVHATHNSGVCYEITHHTGHILNSHLPFGFLMKALVRGKLPTLHLTGNGPRISWCSM